MGATRLFWKIYPIFLVVIVIALGAVTVESRYALQAAYLDQLGEDLKAHLKLLEEPVRTGLGLGDTAGLTADCRRWSAAGSGRITVLGRDGAVLADGGAPSAKPARSMADRPEVVEALATGQGSATRYSLQDGQDMLFVAQRVDQDGRPLGLVRAACPLAPIEERLHSLYVQVGWAGGLMALLAAVVSYLLYRRIDRPLREIQRGAERFAQGHFDARISLSRVGDDGGLTETLNRMAAQLHDRMATVVRQRNEHEAILSSMIEGVLAVDAEERVISMNQVAARMFGATPESVRGKLLQEVVRAPALHEFVQRALAVETPQEAEFERNDRGESRTLQVHGATLHDAAHRRLGVVVVINDVTRVRRLEGLQREFVANVSHELKTPVTSIKGFIETLQDGALENKEDAARFLEIIARHADRLETIIEDLLLLSRIDQDADSATLDRHETPLLGLIDTAAEACAVRAEDKQVILEIECPEDLRVSVGERLFTQVLVNLIDNAVKYSDAGKAVKITAAAAGSEVTVKVRDFGPGIERQHLERLGERFYRVDKARSRKLGGTGLGLAIARQIMQAHGGRLEIESTVGEGSTFSVILPVHFSES